MLRGSQAAHSKAFNCTQQGRRLLSLHNNTCQISMRTTLLRANFVHNCAARPDTCASWGGGVLALLPDVTRSSQAFMPWNVRANAPHSRATPKLQLVLAACHKFVYHR